MNLRRAGRLGASLVLSGCVSVPEPALPPDPEPGARALEPLAPEPPAAPARGAIVACGRRIPLDAPVVLWTDPGGYDATSTAYHFGLPPPGAQTPRRPGGLRYTPGRRTSSEEGGRVLVEPGTTDLEALGRVVRQFVVHYDVCGLSRTCFKVLHDRRGLSVHFMLDIDGTLYQTMDLRDQAWHASQANPYSIGVEIANMGARPARERAELDEWYVRDTRGVRIRIPAWAGDGGVRTPAFVGRPARPDIVRGQVHGEDLWMYDLTPEQYDTLVELTATLCRLFPQIEPDAPRDRARRVRTDALSDSEQARFAGVIGHHHLTERKRDPGPAFDWEGFLEAVRFRLRLQGVP